MIVDKNSKPKDLLEYGVVVETRNGTRYLYKKGSHSDVFSREHGRLLLSEFDDDLNEKYQDSEFDIVTIYEPINTLDLTTAHEIRWKRDELPILTLAEIKQKLGFDFILKEDK